MKHEGDREKTRNKQESTNRPTTTLLRLLPLPPRTQLLPPRLPLGLNLDLPILLTHRSLPVDSFVPEEILQSGQGDLSETEVTGSRDGFDGKRNDELSMNGVPSGDGEELELGSEDGDLLDVNERVGDGEEIELDVGEEGAVEGEVSESVDGNFRTRKFSHSVSPSVSEDRSSKDEVSKLGPGFGEDLNVSVVETTLEFDVLEVREGLKEEGSAGRRGRNGAGDDERAKHVFVGTFSDGLEKIGSMSLLEGPSRRHLKAEFGKMLVVNEDGSLDPDEGSGVNETRDLESGSGSSDESGIGRGGRRGEDVQFVGALGRGEIEPHLGERDGVDELLLVEGARTESVKDDGSEANKGEHERVVSSKDHDVNRLSGLNDLRDVDRVDGSSVEHHPGVEDRIGGLLLTSPNPPIPLVLRSPLEHEPTILEPDLPPKQDRSDGEPGLVDEKASSCCREGIVDDVLEDHVKELGDVERRYTGLKKQRLYHTPNPSSNPTPSSRAPPQHRTPVSSSSRALLLPIQPPLLPPDRRRSRARARPKLDRRKLGSSNELLSFGRSGRSGRLLRVERGGGRPATRGGSCSGSNGGVRRRSGRRGEEEGHPSRGRRRRRREGEPRGGRKRR
ncbi:hypothetical protein BDY24DRAFT_376436 [Mrakia frigida]|uniref:uncharacterized protein n=1 Tax=Mrakia frigida TaxID=29902 RepID=UPI003FCC0563